MKGLDEDECSVKPVPFTVQYIKCFYSSVLFYCLWFFLSQQGWAFTFLFVPGRGGPFEMIDFMSLACLPSTAISPPFTSTFTLFLPSRSFLSLLHLLLTSSSFSPFLHVFFFCIYSSFLSPCPCLKGPLGALWFVCWKAYRHHRRHHWNLALFLPRSLPFPLSLSPFFFSSSLFNVEVLSNCWLLLWFGGNGIFRRMPHTMASIHSRPPPPTPPHHTHTLQRTNIGGSWSWDGIWHLHTQIWIVKLQTLPRIIHAKAICCWWGTWTFLVMVPCFWKNYKDVTR